MIRKAFKMRVFPEQLAEYTRRHQPIWPELQEVLKAHGVSNYSIFHDAETHALLGYAEVASDEQWAAIAGTDVCQRWWQYMRELMETNADASPVSVELREVFHLA
ncbi:L-rhamnose mutarotase [Neolewinella maritima]|uniref:L-rhamnose mutarotase n=1 Tax=Neolewinella maritima TaxID=1383882 RepID=A0ABN8F4I0_9BACT|nr:L-rhamnose mutarotase [Neolewinella maritima]CAH1001848.1 L-rhamnose mutarotase [Neolewinella maritima]